MVIGYLGEMNSSQTEPLHSRGAELSAEYAEALEMVKWGPCYSAE